MIDKSRMWISSADSNFLRSNVELLKQCFGICPSGLVRVFELTWRVSSIAHILQSRLGTLGCKIAHHTDDSWHHHVKILNNHSTIVQQGKLDMVMRKSMNHLLVVLPRTTRSESIVYKRVLTCLAQNFSVIYAAEPHTEKVVEKMSRLEAATNRDNRIPRGRIAEYLRKGLLSIRAPNEVHASLKGSHQTSIAWANKNPTSRGLLVIRAPVSILRSRGNLVEFENAISWKMNDDLHICWYDDDREFDRLSFEQMIFLLQCHHASIHNGWSYREWHLEDIHELVAGSIDEELGKGTSYLVFKTMKLVYNLKEQALYSDPKLLRMRLRRIIGEKATDLVIANASNSIRKALEFTPVRVVPRVQPKVNLSSLDPTSTF
jgi:hypothetical protein